jgi:hypothetical protein
MPTPRKHANAAERQAAYRRRQAVARAAQLQAKNFPVAPAISTMPGTARWKALEEHAKVAIETMLREMENYRDERSEEWQEGERGEEFDERIEAVQNIRDAFEELS